MKVPFIFHYLLVERLQRASSKVPTVCSLESSTYPSRKTDIQRQGSPGLLVAKIYSAFNPASWMSFDLTFINSLEMDLSIELRRMTELSLDLASTSSVVVKPQKP